eukprot:TRINITY_DN55377_c0_g1_i1.p1 TRINITY_DN55377_c0_g1~~TRINITY_DN55377_c0_g1_i1.p1  ORF type:complete len:151 (-),score=36.04 TRINITY_DN55377_c0_g1_i1:194-646(-)
MAAGSGPVASAKEADSDKGDIDKHLQAWLKPLLPFLDPVLRSKYVLNPVPTTMIIIGFVILLSGLLGPSAEKRSLKGLIILALTLLFVLERISVKLGIAAEEHQRKMRRREEKRRAREAAAPDGPEQDATLQKDSKTNTDVCRRGGPKTL